MAEDWLSRWEEGRIGWHEADGNASLKKHWPELPQGSRVLVPLCGKSPDVLWLGSKGYRVTGVELSEIAVRSFFDEASLEYAVSENNGLKVFKCTEPEITMVCGDYFSFTDGSFDALYDRASLIALPSQIRPAYATHTKSLLKPGAGHLLVTLEYHQEAVAGPPFSVLRDEVRSYWDNLECVSERNAIDGCPPKFRNAGLTDVTEVVWIAR